MVRSTVLEPLDQTQTLALRPYQVDAFDAIDAAEPMENMRLRHGVEE